MVPARAGAELELAALTVTSQRKGKGRHLSFDERIAIMRELDAGRSLDAANTNAALTT